MAKAMKRKAVGGKGRARPSSRGLNKGNVARRDITPNSESEDDDDDDDMRLEKETEPRTPPSVNPGVAVTAESEGHAEAISELRENSVGQEYYKYNNQMAELKAKLERLEAEVKKQQDLGPTSGLNGASIKKPEVLVNDHLRKFVAEKIFPGWKFIFNKEKLGRVVSAAVKQGYITKPDGVGEEEMRECYRRSVRTCLDGCRHNAQSAARRRFIGKWARDMLEVIRKQYKTNQSDGDFCLCLCQRIYRLERFQRISADFWCRNTGTMELHSVPGLHSVTLLQEFCQL